MLVIDEWIVLLAAGIIAIVGVLSNAGAAHPLTDFPCSAITGTLFLFGIAVGAVASLGVGLLPQRHMLADQTLDQALPI